MKNLQNLKGSKALNKQEQQSINGGGGYCINECAANVPCPEGSSCVTFFCGALATIDYYSVCVGDGANQ